MDPLSNGSSMHSGVATSKRAARRTIQPTPVDDGTHVAATSAAVSAASAALDRSQSSASRAFAAANHHAPASSPPPTSPAKQALLDSALQRAGKRKREAGGGESAAAAAAPGQQELREERKDASDFAAMDASVVPLRRAAARQSRARPVMLLQRQSSGAAAGDYASDSDPDDEDWRGKSDSDDEEAYGARKTKAKPKRKSVKKAPAAATTAAGKKAAPAVSAAAAAVPAAVSASAAAVAAPVPPAAPVFNPAHLPSAEICAASASVVRRRFDTILENTEAVGRTTAGQRSRMPKDLLLQRNLEIQRQLLHMDASYDELLELKPEKWEQSVSRLDALSDELAEESDELETLLFEKFRVRGGGRTLASDEGLEAAQFGASMAHQHRERGMPMPKLSAPVVPPADSDSAATSSSAASAAASAGEAAPVLNPHHVGLLPIPEEPSTDDGAAVVVKTESGSSGAAAGESAVSRSGSAGTSGSSSAAASSSAPSASSAVAGTAADARMSKSDAAMWAKFDAAQEATRARRAERKAKQAEGLLGHYLEYFDRFVDVDRPSGASPRRNNNTPRKMKALPPASFPLYLGTIVMPLFTDASVIRAPEEKQQGAAQSDPANPAASAAAVNGSVSPVPAASPSLAASLSLSSASSHGRKRRRDSGSADRLADGLSEDDSSAVGSDDAGGGAEEVWLDFLADPSYIDGAVVKQVRPLRSALDNNATETITLGVLPLQGMHPPMPEEPEVQLDAEGQPIPQRPRARPMPDASHPLAALYILHEGSNIIRLESTLIRRKSPVDSAAAAASASSSAAVTPAAASPAFDQVEVSIHVNSRIFSTQLLRSNAQRQAMLTLFHLFSPPSGSAAARPDLTVPAPAPRYTNAAGVEVAYADLTDEERHAWARTAHGAGASVEAAVAPVAPAAVPDDGPSAMDLDDGDSPAPLAVVRASTVAASASSSGLPSSAVADSSSSITVPASASAASASPSAPSKQQLPSGKRQAVSSTPLSLIDQTIAGDDIGESDDEDDEDEDEEDEDEDGEDDESDEDADGLESLESDNDEADSADELFDEVLAQDHFVFVDLKAPTPEEDEAEEPTGAAAMTDAADPAASPTSSASASSEIKVKLEPVEEEDPDQQLSAEEAAEYDSLARANAKLDGAAAAAKGTAADDDGVPLDDEEQELEAEQKQKWRPDSLHALFESIRPTPQWTLAAAQPEGLTCTLRPFQQKALAWMMAREDPPESAVFEDALWQRVALNGRPAWYQPFLGIVSREEPPKHKEIRGGVLAEEMGLGKTVEVIALILAKPWVPGPVEPMELIDASPAASMPVVKLEEDEERKSMDDVDGGGAEPKEETAAPAVRPPPTRIGATLIVSPMSIVHQWKKEILLHAPSLRVTIYPGCQTNLPVAEAAEEYARTMAQFASSDVVLVNYPTLNKEVNYSRECMHGLREKKRYAVPQSALLDCHWLRVILDEAQMVHNALSVCFRMAARLTCDARWCVSGTPIGPQGLHDLYGLVSFLGVQPYSAPGIWRHAMRTKEPAGLERLRQLLRRIMWRHSKAHVESECSIPALHLRKLYLDFNSVEQEVYEDLRLKARTKVLYSAQKNDLEDRTAFHKLDLLRQVCSHPQANAEGHFGKSFMEINEMEKRWIQITQDELTSSERRLCREINKMALECIAQGKMAEAEELLTQSWRISDRGFAASGLDGSAAATAAAAAASAAKPEKAVEGRHSFKARATHAQTIADESIAAAGVSVKSAAAPKSTLLDNFETDVNIKTANEQVLKWRHIDLVVTYNLARIYRSKIEAIDGAELPANDARELSIGQESCEEVFQRAMREAEAVVLPRSMGDRSWAAMADAAADDAAFELPPQLMGASAAASSSSAAASAASSAPSSSAAAIDLSEEPDDSGTDRSSLLRKYHRQCAQYDFSLHELLDLFERKMADAAFLIAHKYEAELLPSWVATSLPDVQTLYNERARVGVDRFNSDSELYMSRVTGLEELLAARSSGVDDILMLYDLQRWVLLIEGLQRTMAENPMVVARKAAWLTELKRNERFLALQKTCGALAKPKKRAASKKPSKASAAKAKAEAKEAAREARVRREPRGWFDGLQSSLTKYRASIRKYEKKIDEAHLAEMHADEHYKSTLPMDSPLRVLRAKYDAQWHQLRDSLGALRTMIEVREERRKMRMYARKMIDHQCGIMREARIITPEQAAQWTRQRLKEVESMDDSGQQPKKQDPEGDESPKKKKAKRASSKEEPAAAAAAAASASSSTPPVAAAAAAVAAAAAPVAASSIPAPFVPFSPAPAPSPLVVAHRESILRDHLQAIKVAKQLCQSRHSKVLRVRSLFGSSVPECRDQECAICKKLITAPILTSCLHWFDHHCFMHWRQMGKNTCPICREILANEDFVRCKLSALATQQIKLEEKAQAKAQAQEAAAAASSDQLSRRSSSGSSGRKSHHADSSSTVAASGVASSSAASASLRPLPPLDMSTIRAMPLVGEGQCGTKIEMVCKAIKLMKQADPTVQILVFSQFSRVLQMTAKVLEANAISALHLEGTPDRRAKLLDAFQSDPAHTVLLLNLRHDNSGLTLVSASAVCLLEPSLNPSVEAQAINRIHRIGQRRETTVLKFLMRGSIEEDIEAMGHQQRQGQAVATGGDALTQHGREGISVKQLLTVFGMADDDDEERIEAIRAYKEEQQD